MDTITVVAFLFGLVTVVALCLWLWKSGQGGRFTPLTRAAKLKAERRADALLAEMLGEVEFQQLSRRGYLEVRSPNMPGRVYRIPAYKGRIGVYDSGKAAMRLCVGPVRALPKADVVLTHKLMIEANEAEYLRIANRL